MCTPMRATRNSGLVVILWVDSITMRTGFNLMYFAPQINLLFVFDELSDDQDGKDAMSTGNIFLNAMKDPNWDDHSSFSQMTKEYVPTYSLRA